MLLEPIVLMSCCIKTLQLVQWILLSHTNKVCKRPKTDVRLMGAEVMAQGEEQTTRLLLVLNCDTNLWWNQCI